MRIFNNRNIAISFCSLLLFFIIFATSFRAMADDVVLNPGFISGQVQIGDEVLKDVRLTAQFGSFTSITSINPTEDLTSVSYNLTVNVPEGTTPDYRVYANTFRLNNKFNDNFKFLTQLVNVSAFQTSTADFVIEDPGFIVGTVTVIGEPNTSFQAGLTAQGPNTIVNGVNLSRFESSTTTNNNKQGAFRIVVLPGENIKLKCRVTINGIRSETEQFVDVSPGEIVTVDCEVQAPPPETGSLEVSISTPGPLTPDYHTFQIARSGRTITRNVNTDGTYSFNGLPVSLPHKVICSTIFNNERQSFRHPLGSYSPATTDRRYDVTAGATTQVDILSPQAFITGKVNITGKAPLADLGHLYVFAQGIENTNTEDGTGRDPRVDRTTGNYELILTDGPWSIYETYMVFINSSINAGYTWEDLRFKDFTAEQNPIIASAENPGTKDFNLATGEVSVNFSIAGQPGATLSNPSLRGSCSLRDDNDEVVSRYTFSSRNSDILDAETASVRFFGMEGMCTVTAQAIVAGSSVTFGKFTVEVVPGTGKVIDIGGPTLTVVFPEPDFITSNSSITVTGIVTDDVEVAGVTVNGVDAALVSTGNPSDEAEMSFSATIPLQRGPNEVITVATDTADPAKTGSDTRTVFRDEGPPTLSWTPGDGAVLPLTEAMTSIDGIADDDAGIKSITVNGEAVTFLPAGNTAQPNEVSFNTSLLLALGDNYITVVATDISNRITTQTHMITVTENSPPVAKCSSVTVSSGADCTANASIDDGSYDPDGDLITLTQSPAGPYGLGITAVTLTVTDDSGTSDTCTTTVTVVDDTAPTVTASASPDYLWPANHKMQQIYFTASITDICDASPGAITVVSVTSDESDNGWNAGDGNTVNDIQFDVDGNLYLRAERSAKGDGRVYTIKVKSTDESGNTGYATFTVEVPRNQSSHSCDDPDCDLNTSS